jgi:thiamine biosynthesis lipoprotein
MADGTTRSLPRREALKITAVTGISLAFGGALATAIARQAGLHRVRATRTQMGTPVTITIVHPDADAAREMVDVAFAEIERLEAILSRHRTDTPVARLNRKGVLDDAPAELVDVLGRALRYSALSAGAFDVTVAPLVQLYHSRFSTTGLPPSDGELATALALVGHDRVRITGQTIRFDVPGMAITLDGIAKGYVVDRTVGALVSAGAERVLVGASGDMASTGSDGEPWRVAIQDPRDINAFLDTLELRGDCIATSGDYMQSFTQDRRFHHIVDPRTGRSPEHTSSVTVLTRTAVDADALSTSAFVLGPAEGLALLEGTDGAEGLIVSKQQEEVRTRGFGRHTA